MIAIKTKSTIFFVVLTKNLNICSIILLIRDRFLLSYLTA